MIIRNVWITTDPDYLKEERKTHTLETKNKEIHILLYMFPVCHDSFVITQSGKMPQKQDKHA